MFQNVIGGPVAYAAVLRARGRAGFARRTVLFAVAFERAVEVPKEEARGPLAPQPASADGKFPRAVRPHPKSRKRADECVALKLVPYVCLIAAVIGRVDSTTWLAKS
jgi:hypothetical protein